MMRVVWAKVRGDAVHCLRSYRTNERDSGPDHPRDPSTRRSIACAPRAESGVARGSGGASRGCSDLLKRAWVRCSLSPLERAALGSWDPAVERELRPDVIARRPRAEATRPTLQETYKPSKARSPQVQTSSPRRAPS